MVTLTLAVVVVGALIALALGGAGIVGATLFLFRRRAPPDERTLPP